MKHTTEQELMEAFAREALEMPDIEAELARVRAKARPSRWRWTAAACVVLLVGFAAISLSRSGNGDSAQGENMCIAYVGGECITDEAAVMRLMASDMHEMNTADDIVAAQLNDIFNE